MISIRGKTLTPDEMKQLEESLRKLMAEVPGEEIVPCVCMGNIMCVASKEGVTFNNGVLFDGTTWKEPPAPAMADGPLKNNHEFYTALRAAWDKLPQ